MPVSMAYLVSEAVFVNAGRDGSFQDQFVPALGLYILNAVDTAISDREQHCGDHKRTPNDNSLDRDNQQHDLNKRNKHTDRHNLNHCDGNYHVIFEPVGPADSYPSDRGRSGFRRDGRRRGSDQKKA